MSSNRLQHYHELATKLLEQYRIVDRVVNEIVAKNDSNSPNETLEMINQLLAGIKHTESEIQPIRDALAAENATVPEPTRKTIDEAVQIVTSLIPRIGALEKDAIEARERLTPVIREGVRAAKMKSAYAKQHTRNV